jgi:hypothetical protein
VPWAPQAAVNAVISLIWSYPDAVDGEGLR